MYIYIYYTQYIYIYTHKHTYFGATIIHKLGNPFLTRQDQKGQRVLNTARVFSCPFPL